MQGNRPDTRSGGTGEDFAAARLEEMGYTIVARNAHSRWGEVDIIAEKDFWLCFVEVKTRRTDRLLDGAQAVSRAKQRRIIQTALDWMQRFPAHTGQPRFDVFLVGTDSFGRVLCHDYLEGAFDGEAYTGSARD